MTEPVPTVAKVALVAMLAIAVFSLGYVIGHDVGFDDAREYFGGLHGGPD